jgi:hypothetical protein
MIHRWDMADSQKSIHDMLIKNSHIEIIDKSYTSSNPAPMAEYIQDYACGQMQDSDIVIVLPDSEEQYYSTRDKDYLSDLFHDFGNQRGLKHDCVYITELKTLLFDSCDRVPVLILGWTIENAKYIANILRKGYENRYYDKKRFFIMGVNEIIDEFDLIAKIIHILKIKNGNNLRCLTLF